MQIGKQSLQFEEPPYIVSSANIVGTKEGQGPLKEYFDVVQGSDMAGKHVEKEDVLKMSYFDSVKKVLADW